MSGDGAWNRGGQLHAFLPKAHAAWKPRPAAVDSSPFCAFPLSSAPGQEPALYQPLIAQKGGLSVGMAKSSGLWQTVFPTACKGQPVVDSRRKLRLG